MVRGIGRTAKTKGRFTKRPGAVDSEYSFQIPMSKWYACVYVAVLQKIQTGRKYSLTQVWPYLTGVLIHDMMGSVRESRFYLSSGSWVEATTGGWDNRSGFCDLQK